MDNNDVLIYTEKDVEKIRKIYKVGKDSLRDDLGILRKWIRQEKHLPQNQDDEILERFLMKNKFRLEQTKKKIEGYYTLRGQYEEFRPGNNISDVIPSKQIIFGFPLPRLTRNHQRIFLIKFNNPNPEVFNLKKIMQFLSLVMEIGFKYDYNNGEVILVDLQGVSLDHIKKVNPVELGRAINLAQNGFSGRPVSLNVINVPGFVTAVLSLLKLALPHKLYSRINIHNDLESLYKICPEKCLPKDYGGDLESCEEISRKWDRAFEKHQDFFRINSAQISDENLRVGHVRTDEIFGMEGTFKQLNLD